MFGLSAAHLQSSSNHPNPIVAPKAVRSINPKEAVVHSILKSSDLENEGRSPSPALVPERVNANVQQTPLDDWDSDEDAAGLFLGNLFYQELYSLGGNAAINCMYASQARHLHAEREEKQSVVQSQFQSQIHFRQPDQQQLNPAPQKGMTEEDVIANHYKQLAQANANVNGGKLTVAQRLEKNCRYAKAQQNKEANDNDKEKKDFILYPDPLSQSFAKDPSIEFMLKMRGSLQSRIEQIEYESLSVCGMPVGIASCIGCRPGMEDNHLATELSFESNKQTIRSSLFGVFDGHSQDGHSGAELSKFLKDNLKGALVKAIENQKEKPLTDDIIFHAFKSSFNELNAECKGNNGTTATVVLIINDDIWVANTGDSRTILVSDQQIVQASEDAKPNLKRYVDKIKKLGGFIYKERVCGDEKRAGSLATARAFGDKHLKNKEGICVVSASPKVTKYSLADFQGGYLILACDGLYDVTTTNGLGKEIQKIIEALKTDEGGVRIAKTYPSIAGLARSVVFSALAKNSQDNVSAMIVQF